MKFTMQADRKEGEKLGRNPPCSAGMKVKEWLGEGWHIDLKQLIDCDQDLHQSTRAHGAGTCTRHCRRGEWGSSAQPGDYPSREKRTNMSWASHRARTDWSSPSLKFKLNTKLNSNSPVKELFFYYSLFQDKFDKF